MISEWGRCPEMMILVFDCGGQIDTMQFNRRTDLTELQKRNEPVVREAAALFREGLHTGSVSLIAGAATMSAFANQSILCKKQLPRLYQSGRQAGSMGVIAAHSALCWADFPPGTEPEKTVSAVLADFQEGLEYLDCVSLVNEGLTYKECDDNEFPSGPSRR